MDSWLDGEIIEKFKMNGTISVDEQAQIVDAINRLLAGQDAVIFRDRGHDKSWICIQYRHIAKEQKILFFESKKNFKWDKFKNSNKEFYEKLNGWLPPIVYNVDNVAELFEIPECNMPNDVADQFLLTLVYAIGCSLKYQKYYEEPFGEPENKEKIRQAIAKALMEKRMPTVEEMWGPQPERN